MRLTKTTLFSSLWAFIVLVETYDIYLSIKFQDTLLQMEMNPVGRILIELDNGDIALFMALKVAGLVLLLTSIPILYSLRRAKTAWGFLAVMFISRVLLLAYLETGPWSIYP